MSELSIVLFALEGFYNNIAKPIMEAFYLDDIFFGVLFVFCGYRLLTPLIGASVESLRG